MDLQDMTDEQIELYQTRQWAAGLYRGEGFTEYALRVEHGKVDHCQGMRIARVWRSN